MVRASDHDTPWVPSCGCFSRHIQLGRVAKVDQDQAGYNLYILSGLTTLQVPPGRARERY